MKTINNNDNNNNSNNDNATAHGFLEKQTILCVVTFNPLGFNTISADAMAPYHHQVINRYEFYYVLLLMISFNNCLTICGKPFSRNNKYALSNVLNQNNSACKGLTTLAELPMSWAHLVHGIAAHRFQPLAADTGFQSLPLHFTAGTFYHLENNPMHRLWLHEFIYGANAELAYPHCVFITTTYVNAL